MSWLKKLFDPQAPGKPDELAPAGAQVRMTLEERMLFRRKMVLDAVRAVLLSHGMASPGYRLNVAQLDDRGHRFAIMLEWLPLAASRSISSIGEWRALEEQIIQMAATRYRVHVTGVYWRLNSLSAGHRDPRAPQRGHEDGADSAFAAEFKTPRASGDTAAEPLDSSAKLTGSGALQGLRNAVGWGKKPGLEDDFPDTLLEDRRQGFEGITPQELAAFEAAISRGHDGEQPVELGHRSYQTDFMPLD